MIDLEYTDAEFEQQYNIIKDFLTVGKEFANNKSSILINGLPGSGKSNYETKIEDNSTIIINADEYRRFHPRINEIQRLDAENYAERTQPFIGKIVERLINDLANLNYNLIIEGTLRTSEVPINTCLKLKELRYNVDLVIVVCDACTAWKSTIDRAKEMLSHGLKPRLVPIDKFNYNVQMLVKNIEDVCSRNCFDNIVVVDRSGYIIKSDLSPAKIVEQIIDIDKWNRNISEYEKDFLKNKMLILKKEMESYGIQ